MELKLVRKYKGQDYTIGDLFIDGEFFCNTLEDAVRDVKIKHQTAIVQGKYKVILTLSPRFGIVMPLLLDVPNFTGIRIHYGNHKDHTSGCILVGKNTVKGGLTESRKTFQSLMKILSTADDITLEIE